MNKPLAPLRPPEGPLPMALDMVHTIARIALFDVLDEQQISDLLKAFSLSRLRSQMVGLGLCESDADDREVARLYFSGRCRIISPNEFFDEVWYSEYYPEVAAALKAGSLVSGFVHFMQQGLRRGLWPNKVLFAEAQACRVPGVPQETMDGDAYLGRNPVAAAFITAFPSLSPEDHYNLFGRFLGYSADLRPVTAGTSFSLRVAEAEFDPDFYVFRYLSGDADTAFREAPFDHYARIGMKAGHSPNAWFQEDWYRAFYKEVREGIENGWLPSGFYHYMLTGRIEGRLPKPDMTAALELRMPGVTNPALLARSDMLKTRAAGLKTMPRRSPRAQQTQCIWVFLPTLNPDIMYGGYRAIIAFICALRRDGHAVAVVCLEEDPNAAYFLWNEKSPLVRDVFGQIDILNEAAFCSAEIGRNDLFIAYTVWDLVICDQLAGLTDNSLPLLFAQEYEPIFYDCGAQRALCEACYHIPHYPLINSRFLRSYFEKQGIGQFATRTDLKPDEDYTVFEHKINQLPLQSARSMRTRRHRVLVVYARPEAHAARNLFEVILIALQTLCARGAFGPEWRFVGLGALSKIPPIALGGGHELRLSQKTSEEEYRKIVSEIDIGISLMYAPHPSVVPFEFATTGALVVTNTYVNRSAEELRQICGNILPCDVAIGSVIGAIEQAISLVAEFSRREKQALRPAQKSWDDIFSSDVVSNILTASQTRDRPRTDRVAVQPDNTRPAGRPVSYRPAARGRAAAAIPEMAR